MMRMIVQARMGSSRLPGKILAPLGDRPLLAHVVERLQTASGLLRFDAEVMVATTTHADDNATEAWCRQNGIRCFRGEAEDVLGRFVAAVADLGDDDTVVRATADNPLYCPERSAAIIEVHRTARADYTCVDQLSYIVPEVMRVRALRRMATLTDDPYCREHVTPYFRQRPQVFQTIVLPANWRGLRPEVRLTIDTAEELERMRRLVCEVSTQGRLASLEAVYSMFDASAAELDVAIR
jgi:spore coat polysaccharide biosynthesis protein SpsF